MKRYVLILFALIFAALFTTQVLAQGEDNQRYLHDTATYKTIKKMSKGDIIAVYEDSIALYCDYDRNVTVITDNDGKKRISCSYIGYSREKIYK